MKDGQHAFANIFLDPHAGEQCYYRRPWQGRRFQEHEKLLPDGDTASEQSNAFFLDDEAQGLEDRYRLRDVKDMRFNTAILQHELAPEIEEERQIDRPPKMVADEHRLHHLHLDLQQLARTSQCAVSKACQPAFPALHPTSPAKLFDVARISHDKFATAPSARRGRNASLASISARQGVQTYRRTASDGFFW
ncbi:hypothetical protein P153DRAFT_388034 [Dothidotthia symphoricarpi CBS 119687]|uniref:Uncharacterized protein n=1 Tax=Dothidotthia symphoricarpi CBS 119687 TaxID=1392245 RepID=A0A6A6A7C3_9PLEO|nr:uncharacterized protein P153DRAFT_388034 [Dothidotthia symphoricarpi CBS 119687]KAF2126707.1 hypothetical protein P153DRAFT_388034 [Dothidotthia symphoricarpi CBS 119687]